MTRDEQIQKRLQFARANPKHTDLIREFISDLTQPQQEWMIEEIMVSIFWRKESYTGSDTYSVIPNRIELILKSYLTKEKQEECKHKNIHYYKWNIPHCLDCWIKLVEPVESQEWVVEIM